MCILSLSVLNTLLLRPYTSGTNNFLDAALCLLLMCVTMMMVVIVMVIIIVIITIMIMIIHAGHQQLPRHRPRIHTSQSRPSTQLRKPPVTAPAEVSDDPPPPPRSATVLPEFTLIRVGPRRNPKKAANNSNHGAGGGGGCDDDDAVVIVALGERER